MRRVLTPGRRRWPGPRKLLRIGLGVAVAGAVWATPTIGTSAPFWPRIADVDYFDPVTGSYQSSCDWTLYQDGSVVDCAGWTGTWELTPGASAGQWQLDLTVYSGWWPDDQTKAHSGSGTRSSLCASGSMDWDMGWATIYNYRDWTACIRR